MSDVVLSLGAVAFQDFEVPNSINWGGRQRLAVHEMPGGGRVIDAMGRDDSDIRWTGTFSGPNATGRARLLDELRIAGATLPLSWDVFYASVVIKRFEADYRQSSWVPYRITCAVLPDFGLLLPTELLSAATSITADLLSAMPLLSAAGLDGSSALGELTAAGAMQLGSGNNSAALGTLTRLQNAIGGTIGASGAAINGGVAQLGSASALANVTASAGILANAAQAQSFIGRGLVNLGGAGF